LLNAILEIISDSVSIPLMVLILATGIFLSARTGFVQLKYLPLAFKYMFRDEDNAKGEVSGFASLCTALSSTIGTGNIVGVATAVGILAGGPGALFWMWVAAFFGMATKYAEGLLAVKYRTIDGQGHVLGGPFYYIENGMGTKFRWLAKLFAFFGACVGLLGIGTFSQANSISTVVTEFLSDDFTTKVTILGTDYSIVTIITAALVTLCTGLVVIGGLKRISNVAQFIVPFMAILYAVTVLILFITNITKLPDAILTIIESAFGIRSISGGILASIIMSMRSGVARGIFSNEAGLGSAPIAAAAARTKEPVRQGLISMTGTFIDTIIICTMTGLSIVMMGSWSDESLEGVQVTTDAFQKGLSFLPTAIPAALLMICLIFFAFTTIIGWNYYGERCVEYLCNKSRTAVAVYRVLYIAAVFIGPYMTVTAVWTIADIFNSLMAFPNLAALFCLSSVISKETKSYFARRKKGEIKD
jgi:AGCS family alanine or glycine:cation symporter